jgi:putative oxidoreductase
LCYSPDLQPEGLLHFTRSEVHLAVDTALWILQVLLALAFVGAGLNHATQRDKASGRSVWMLALPKPVLTTIGILEIAGAAGLVLPAMTGIALGLTPLAAALLGLVMVLAAGFHLRRQGEGMNAAMNLVLAAVVAFVAYGRLVLAPYV